METRPAAPFEGGWNLSQLNPPTREPFLSETEQNVKEVCD